MLIARRVVSVPPPLCDAKADGGRRRGARKVLAAIRLTFAVGVTVTVAIISSIIVSVHRPICPFLFLSTAETTVEGQRRCLSLVVCGIGTAIEGMRLGGVASIFPSSHRIIAFVFLLLFIRVVYQ